MHNIIKRGQSAATRFMFAFLTVAAAVMVALSLPGFAHAQTATPTPDTSSFIQYGTLANQGKAEVNTAMSNTAPVVMAVVIGLVAFGLLIRWMQRAPKGS